MRRRTKIILGTLGVVVIGGAATALAAAGSRQGDDDVKTVAAERGTIVDKALAVGRIEPEVEIGSSPRSAASSNADTRRRANSFAPGPAARDQAHADAARAAEARRQVQMREVELANLRLELERNEACASRGWCPSRTTSPPSSESSSSRSSASSPANGCPCSRKAACRRARGSRP